MFAVSEAKANVIKHQYERQIQFLKSELRQSQQEAEYYKQLLERQKILTAEAERKNSGRLN